MITRFSIDRIAISASLPHAVIYNLLVAILLIVVSGTPLHFASADNDKYSIGVALPLTGPIAWVGQSMRRGIELAFQEERAAHPSIEYDVSFEDDLSSNRNSAVTIFKKFTSSQRVDGIINCSTSTLSAVAPIITQSSTPTIILWDSNRSMPSLSPAAIGFGYSNEKAAEDASEFLISKLGRKRIAVINYVNDWSELLTQSFIHHAEKLGATITLSEQVDGSTTDFRSLLARARLVKSDGIYLPMFGPGLTSVLKQIKDLRFNAEIITVDSLGEEELKDAGPAAEGIYVSQIALRDQAFAERLEKLFPGSSASDVFLGYSALAYDGAKFLINRLESVRGRSNVSPKEKLALFKNQTFAGTLGTTTISPEGIADRTIPILKIKSGKFTSINGE
jgi:branched-chain amino acid transport system substrate-binding protein